MLNPDPMPSARQLSSVKPLTEEQLALVSGEAYGHASRVAWAVIHRYSRYAKFFPKDELKSEVHLAICLAASTHDPTRGKFLSWVGKFILWHLSLRSNYVPFIRLPFRPYKKRAETIPVLRVENFDHMPDPDDDWFKRIDTLDECDMILRTAKSILQKNDRAIPMIGMRYGVWGYLGPKSIGSIGKAFDLSKERVRQIMNRGLYRIQQKLIEEGYYAPKEE